MSLIGMIIIFHGEGQKIVEQFVNEISSVSYDNGTAVMFKDSSDFRVAKLALSDAKIAHEVFDFNQTYERHYIFCPKQMKYERLHCLEWPLVDYY